MHCKPVLVAEGTHARLRERATALGLKLSFVATEAIEAWLKRQPKKNGKR